MSTEKLVEITILKERLLRLPAALAQARLDAEATRAAVDTAKAAWQDAEAECVLFVGGETNGGGKPKYGNEQARKAEVRRRLATEPQYAKLAQVLTEAERERVTAEIAVRQLEDEHRAAVAIKDLTCAEVELLVHGR